MHVEKGASVVLTFDRCNTGDQKLCNGGIFCRCYTGIFTKHNVVDTPSARLRPLWIRDPQ